MLANAASHFGAVIARNRIHMMDNLYARSVFFVKDGKIKEWSDYTIRVQR